MPDAPIPEGLGAPREADDRTQLFDQPWLPNIDAVDTVYRGKIWDIRHETFHFGDVKLGRDFMQHTGAVAVLALDECDRLLVIRQYRHALRLREWELPAGLLDVSGESPLVCAQRELAEEADLIASDWSVLLDYATSPGGSNEVVRVYLARGLSDAPEAHAREAEEADMEVRWVTLDEAREAVLQGRVSNSIFVVSILAAVAQRDEGWAHLRAPDAPWPLLQWRDATL